MDVARMTRHGKMTIGDYFSRQWTKETIFLDNGQRRERSEEDETWQGRLVMAGWQSETIFLDNGRKDECVSRQIVLK